MNAIVGLISQNTINYASQKATRLWGNLPPRNGLIAGGVVATGVYMALSPLELFGYIGFGMGKAVRLVRLGAAGAAGVLGAKGYNRLAGIAGRFMTALHRNVSPLVP
jgi:hypothetical protein